MSNTPTDLPATTDRTVNGWSREEARTQPVTDGCVWCGNDASIDVGEEEAICQQCLEDLREFGRYRLVDLIYHGGLEPSVKRILRDEWQAVQAQICEQYEYDADIFPAIDANDYYEDEI